ncbi:MAG: hypothetical protein RIG61_12325 [Deltaproteobacteria bacterium]
MKKSLLMLPIFTVVLAASALIIGCEQRNESVNEEVVEEETVVVEETEPSPEPTAPAHEVKIETGERSPAFPGAKTRFTSLKDGDVLEDPNVSVVLNVESYQLGVQTDTDRAKEIANSEKGQHAHIILDNDPYMADYEAGKPFEIGVLEEGPHTLVVFPSRSYHESVKSSEAAQIVNFYVGKEAGEFMLDNTKPTIIYSRPKGEYKGDDSKKIMLDFYLNNVELGDDGYKAKYTITRKDSDDQLGTITMTEWTPAFVTGLTSGEYVITLQLLDKDGNVVEGSFNNTERVITVETE